MSLKKKIIVSAISTFLAISILFGSTFLFFMITRISNYEKQYLKTNDSKNLVQLCMALANSKDYERQIKYIKEFTNKINFEEFSKIIEDSSSWDENEKEIYYEVILTRYLEAYLHLEKPEQYLSEFPVIYNNYLNEKSCFQNINYSLLNDILSKHQWDTVLSALQSHMKEEKKEIQLFNLDTQVSIYNYQGNKVQSEIINQKIEMLRRELLEE